MDIIEFANKHLSPYKIHGDEVVPTYCPFCQGGSKREKYKFAMSLKDGAYNCRRLNNCGARGSFKQLCEKFGEKPNPDISRASLPRKPKVYRAPRALVHEPGRLVKEFFEGRRISEETYKRRGIGEYKGVIAMPYYENGQVVLMKYRAIKEKKFWKEADGKPVFFGMDMCDPQYPLAITEGEVDCLSLDESGVPNAVSVPSGAEDLSCIENCWEWLEKFKKIIIWPDKDAAGDKMKEKLILRLGQFRCYVVDSPYKDANDHLRAEGAEGVRHCIANAKEVPVAGITQISDVRRLDYSQILRVASNIRGIDSVLGGFRMGELTVWTGINSSGKSTFLSQMLAESIDQGFPVFAYSGELPQHLFKEWAYLQMAGPDCLDSSFDPIEGGYISTVKNEIVPRLDRWCRDMFYLYDSCTASENTKILEICEIAARRYDCKVFLVDNLMTAGFHCTSKDSYFQLQSEFVGKLVDFAKRYDVHIHLVAHPRKAVGKLTKMDVSGSADITNRPDNVVAIHRFSLKEQQDAQLCEHGGADAVAQIFKNRFRGKQDVEVPLKYDINSKRYCQLGDPTSLRKRYSWVGEASLGDNTQGEVGNLFNEEVASV